MVTAVASVLHVVCFGGCPIMKQTKTLELAERSHHYWGSRKEKRSHCRSQADTAAPRCRGASAATYVLNALYLSTLVIGCAEIPLIDTGSSAERPADIAVQIRRTSFGIPHIEADDE